MAVHLRVLLILTGLTGIHSITTVSKVSVKAGDSISIPCLYESQYMHHVKYLCDGSQWLSCSYAVKTNQPSSSGKFSISDDKSQRIFTVTMKNLTPTDTGFYWCVVEINGGADVRQYFHLSVTGGLYVDHQEITGFNGDGITINCYHNNPGEIKWCRLGSYCVSRPSGSRDGTTVTISTPSVFTVTLSRLRTESSGWYWCDNGDLQMPVHITVKEKPTTTTPATARGFSALSPTPPPILVTGNSSASVDLKSLIIPLSVLVFIIMLALFIWFMLKRHKQTKEELATTTAEEEVTYSDIKHKRKTSRQAQEEVAYSNVGYMRKTSGQRSNAENDVDVMYSSVVTIKKPTIKRAEAEDMDVAYSTLAQPHQKM